MRDRCDCVCLCGMRRFFHFDLCEVGIVRVVYTFVCRKCGSDTRFISIIQDQVEITNILQHLAKQGRASPGCESCIAQLTIESYFFIPRKTPGELCSILPLDSQRS